MGGIFDMIDSAFAQTLRLSTEEYIEIVEHKFVDDEMDILITMFDKELTFAQKRLIISTFNKYRENARITSR